MLLSIGMIVKNEEKYLDRCLTALKPIMEKIDSELIIADTGSTDSTVEIAKRHTDNVFHFDWINDFSAARNFTLEKSQGDWFMFIDADEIFETYDDIINFFTSREHTKYFNAGFRIRNYNNENNWNSFNDFYALRLFRKLPEIKFHNAVHENFEPSLRPTKFMDDIVGHYGYLFDSDEELKNKKIERNLSMLLEELENGGGNFLIYDQLSDIYTIQHNFEKATEYLETGLEKTLSDGSDFALVYFISRMKMYMLTDDFEGAVEFYAKYSSKFGFKKGKAIVTDCEMLFYYADALMRLGKTAESVAAYVDFFTLYKSFKNGKLRTDDLLFASLVFQKPANIKKAFQNFAMMCIAVGKYNTLSGFMKTVALTDFPDDTDFVTFCIDVQFELSNKIGCKNLPKLYSELNQNAKKIFADRARYGIFQCNNQSERIDTMLSISSLDKEVTDIFEVYKEYLVNNSVEPELIFEFIDKYDCKNYPEMIYLLLIINADLAPILTKDFFDLEYYKENCQRFPGIADIAMLYDISEISAEALEKAAAIFRYFLFDKIVKKETYKKELAQYSEIGKRWLAEFDDENSASILIKECIAFSKMMNFYVKKQYRSCLSELRILLTYSRDFTAIVSDYQKMIKEAIEPKENQNKNNELAEMSAAVKKNIRNMIAAGKFIAAQKALRELAQLVPGDPEIDMLYEELEKAR